MLYIPRKSGGPELPPVRQKISPVCCSSLLCAPILEPPMMESAWREY